MTEPTREQIKELLKKCGFKEVRATNGCPWWQYDSYKETSHWWEAPNGMRYKEIPLLIKQFNHS